MSNVRIENYFSGKVAPGSVESEKTVSSHCRGEREERKREAGQAFGCTHAPISTIKFQSQSVTNMP